MKKTFLTALLFSFTLSTICCQVITWINHIQTEMKGLPDGTEFSIGIFDGAELLQLGYRMENGACVQIQNFDQIFEIGSVTKTFTATLAMKLVEEEQLHLSDPVDKHLPVKLASNEYEGQSITVQHLITHTSGLSDAPSSFVLPALGAMIFSPKNANKNFKAKQYYRYLRKFELDYLPGANWAYRNANYGLLGELIEQRYNRSWEDAVTAYIFEPLGMENSCFLINESNSNRFVTGLTAKGKSSKSWEMDFINPAGVIKSTLNDMMAYTMAQLQSPSEELSYFSATHDPLDFTIKMPEKSLWKNNAMGLGWWHNLEDETHPFLWHSGATGGYSSFAGFSKESGQAVVILSNISSSHPASRADNRMPIPTYLGQMLLRNID